MPPAPTKFTVPVAVPKHLAAIGVAVKVNTVGCVNVTVVVVTQPTASLTVILYVPGNKPEKNPLPFIWVADGPVIV